MNEHQFANRVRTLLNQAEVDPGVAARLKAAREQALARQRPEPAPALAWADNVLGSLGGWSGLSLRVLVPVLLLATALAGIYGWQQNQRVAEVEDIDAQLLTDDLPVEAYLDHGFQNWLKKRAAEQ
jgi:hypothetical protein